jgi:hypothetical protein
VSRIAQQRLALAALVALPVLVFVNAAVGIDAPVFVAVGQQLVAHPFDPFGFDMIWDPTSPHVWEFNHNPPLYSYVLALPLALFGAWEPALHLVSALFPLVAIFAFAGIARRLCGDGFAPAIVLAATPAFLLLATTLMLDVPVLAFFLLAVYGLLRAVAGDGVRWEWLAGFACAAAGLTKYVGFSAFPLLVAGLVLLSPARPGLTRWGRVLGPPMLVWGGWALVTWLHYGAVHFAGGVQLVGQKSFAPAQFWNQLASVPVYYGGALLFPICVWFERVRRGRGGIEIAVVGLLAGVAIVTFLLPEGKPARRVGLDLEEAMFCALAFAGACVVWGQALVPLRRLREHTEEAFLACWLVGFFAFSAFVNWHTNAADALMAAPPALLLLFRHPETRPSPRQVGVWVALLLPLSLLLTASDVEQRNAYRDTAQKIGREIGDAPGQRFFVGHWGFQYYLEREGFRAVVPPQYERSYGASEIARGDWIASARNVSQLDVSRHLDRFTMRVAWRFPVESSYPLRATQPDAGAGFYSHQSGYGPLAWSWVPVEEIGLAQVTGRRR